MQPFHIVTSVGVQEIRRDLPRLIWAGIAIRPPTSRRFAPYASIQAGGAGGLYFVRPSIRVSTSTNQILEQRVVPFISGDLGLHFAGASTPADGRNEFARFDGSGIWLRVAPGASWYVGQENKIALSVTADLFAGEDAHTAWGVVLDLVTMARKDQSRAAAER